MRKLDVHISVHMCLERRGERKKGRHLTGNYRIKFFLHLFLLMFSDKTFYIHCFDASILISFHSAL